MKQQNRLYPEDQAKVDEFLRTGCNSVERKPFRPWILLVMLVVVTITFGVLSMGIAAIALR